MAPDSQIQLPLYWNRSGLLFNQFVLTVIPIHIFLKQLLIGILFSAIKKTSFITNPVIYHGD
jgi:hypothetical protein